MRYWRIRQQPYTRRLVLTSLLLRNWNVWCQRYRWLRYLCILNYTSIIWWICINTLLTFNKLTFHYLILYILIYSKRMLLVTSQIFTFTMTQSSVTILLQNKYCPSRSTFRIWKVKKIKERIPVFHVVKMFSNVFSASRYTIVKIIRILLKHKS